MVRDAYNTPPDGGIKMYGLSQSTACDRVYLESFERYSWKGREES